jgi:hypothetical protein
MLIQGGSLRRATAFGAGAAPIERRRNATRNAERNGTPPRAARRCSGLHSSCCSHVDHSQRVQADETKKQWKQGTKRKVGLFQREVLLSPSKTKMPFKKVRRELRAKGIVVDKSNNSAFQQAHRQAKDDKFKSDTGCEVKDKNKIGALMCLLEEHSYDTKKDSAGSDFSEDTTFVMNGWKIDVQTQYIAFLVTTDKLLRNIYLQAKSGAPSYIAVDCTHRLVNKGHACIVFGTMDLEQKFHKVAYGMISTKGQGCHEHCFEMLIDAVNAQATRENLPAVRKAVQHRQSSLH